MQHLSPKAELIAQDADQMVAILSADGELLLEIPLRRGVTKAREVLNYLPPNGTWQVSEGVTVLAPGGKLFLVQTEGHEESAANPDIRPRLVTESEKRLESQLRRQQAQTNRMIAELSARIGAPAAREAVREAVTPPAATSTAPDPVEPVQPTPPAEETATA